MARPCRANPKTPMMTSVLLTLIGLRVSLITPIHACDRSNSHNITIWTSQLDRDHIFCRLYTINFSPLMLACNAPKDYKYDSLQTTFLHSHQNRAHHILHSHFAAQAANHNNKSLILYLHFSSIFLLKINNLN